LLTDGIYFFAIIRHSCGTLVGTIFLKCGILDFEKIDHFGRGFNCLDYGELINL